MYNLPTPTGGERAPRLIDALCYPEPRTPLPVPLPSRCDGATARRVGRGEGASSAVLVHTEVPGQGEAMPRTRSFLNSTAVGRSPGLYYPRPSGGLHHRQLDACKVQCPPPLSPPQEVIVIVRHHIIKRVGRRRAGGSAPYLYKGGRCGRQGLATCSYWAAFISLRACCLVAVFSDLSRTS